MCGEEEGKSVGEGERQKKNKKRGHMEGSCHFAANRRKAEAQGH